VFATLRYTNARLLRYSSAQDVVNGLTTDAVAVEEAEFTDAVAADTLSVGISTRPVLVTRRVLSSTIVRRHYTRNDDDNNDKHTTTTSIYSHTSTTVNSF